MSKASEEKGALPYSSKAFYKSFTTIANVRYNGHFSKCYFSSIRLTDTSNLPISPDFPKENRGYFSTCNDAVGVISRLWSGGMVNFFSPTLSKTRDILKEVSAQRPFSSKYLGIADNQDEALKISARPSLLLFDP